MGLNKKFPTKARLLRPAQFAITLKGRRIARGKLLVLISNSQNNSELQARPRLGLIVGKRFAPKAITRNTIKRVLREAFRHNQHQLKPKDYIFRLHSPVGDTSLTKLKKTIRSEAEIMLERAKK